MLGGVIAGSRRRAAVVAAGFKGVRATLSTPFNATKNAWTAIPFDTEDYDKGGWHDTGANTHQLVVPAGVTHAKFRAHLQFNNANSATEPWGFLAITQNGTFIQDASETRAAQYQQITVTVETPIMEVAEGDIFVANYFNRTGSATYEIDATTFFCVEAYDLADFNGAVVSRTGNTPMSRDAYTPVPFPAELHDDANIHDNAVNNTRLTVPAGVTRVAVSFMSEITNAWQWNIAIIIKNGTTTVARGGMLDNGGYVRTNILLNTGFIDVVAGDYFELWSWTPATVATDNTARTWGMMEIEPIGLSAARVGLSGNVALAASTALTIAWDTEGFDTDGYFDAGVNAERLVVPAGVDCVDVLANVQINDLTSTGDTRVVLRKNGVAVMRQTKPWFNGNNQTMSLLQTGPIPVVPGDYFDVAVIADEAATIVGSLSYFQMRAVPDFS